MARHAVLFFGLDFDFLSKTRSDHTAGINIGSFLDLGIQGLYFSMSLILLAIKLVLMLYWHMSP